MSADHSTRHEELLPAYALGAVDGEDLREMASHLATGCAECRRQLDLWQGDLEELAASLLIAVWSGLRQARLGDELERLGAERDRLAQQVSGLDQQLGLTRSEANRMAESLAIIT